MKALSFIFAAIAATLWIAVCQAEPPTGAAPGTPAPAMDTNVPANYVISVQWKDSRMGSSRYLQIMTSGGPFNADALEQASTKNNGLDIPSTIRLSGELTVLNPQKGRLKLFIGRMFTYSTATPKSPAITSPPAYQQLSLGLDSTLVVTFGKSLVIQGDENGQISILVKRDEG